MMPSQDGIAGPAIPVRPNWRVGAISTDAKQAAVGVAHAEPPVHETPSLESPRRSKRMRTQLLKGSTPDDETCDSPESMFVASAQEVVSQPLQASGCSTEPGSHDSSLVWCRCRGSCGQRVCKRNKNLFHRGMKSGDAPPFCDMRPEAPSQEFCSLCACEACGLRQRQHGHGHGRWCTGCSPVNEPPRPWRRLSMPIAVFARQQGGHGNCA